MDEFVRGRVRQHSCLFLKTGFVQTSQIAECLGQVPGSATATAMVALVTQVATATPGDETRAGSSNEQNGQVPRAPVCKRPYQGYQWYYHVLKLSQTVLEKSLVYEYRLYVIKR
jgi:hypothetical protein